MIDSNKDKYVLRAHTPFFIDVWTIMS